MLSANLRVAILAPVENSEQVPYPALLTPEEHGGFLVTFRDIPEAITEGETFEEALRMGADALATVLDSYYEDQRAAPAPSDPRHGEYLVAPQYSKPEDCHV